MKNVIKIAAVAVALSIGCAHAAEGSSVATPPVNITYWQDFANGAPAVTLGSLANRHATIIDVAFGSLSADGSVTYTPTIESQAQMISDIAALHAAGKKVLLSLGGQNANFSQAGSTFENDLENIITTYNFDGVDYDLENGLSASNVGGLITSTQNIINYFKAKDKTLIFTTAPQTLDLYNTVIAQGTDPYVQLIKSGLINYTAIQLYNTGQMYWPYQPGTEDFTTAYIDNAIVALKKIGVADPEKLLVLGFPSNSSAAGSGITSVTDVNKAFLCLKTGTSCQTYQPTSTYPNLAGVMDWDINWDANNSYDFDNNVNP